MKKRILALLLCGLMVFSSTPVTPLGDVFTMRASAAGLDLFYLESTLELIPPKTEWGKYINTEMLEMWYDTAEDMISDPDSYTQKQVDNCVEKLREAYDALEYHTTGIKLNKTSLSAYIGKVVTLNATLTPSNAADDIEWTTSDSNVATVTQNGQVTIRSYSSKGVRVTATSNGYSASCKITTLNQLGSVKLSDTDVTLYEAAGATVKATALGKDTSAETTDEVSYMWDTSNPSVATVSDSGYIKGVSKGTAIITCTASSTNGSVTAKCTVTVRDIVRVSSLQPLTVTTTSGLVLTEGETETFKVTVLPVDASIKKLTWKSSDTSVVKVSDSSVTSNIASAKITAVKAGKAKITYSATDGSGKSGYFTVDVRPRITSFTISQSVKVITPDTQEAKLTVKILPSNAGNQKISWSSSDPAVCQVDYAGYLYPKAYGLCTITGKTTDGSNLTVSCKVRVADKASALSLNRSTLSLKNGKYYTLKATVRTVTGSTYGEVKWSSDNTKVASVSSSGLVKAKYPGKATITATTLDGTKRTAVCVVTVTQPLTSISIAENANVPLGKTKQLKVTFTPSYATNKNVTWASSDTTVVTVSSSGLIYGKKTGTATVHCFSADGGYSDSCEVRVYVPATGIKISKTSGSMWAGTTATLSATVSPSGATFKTVRWSSSNTKVATVSSKGVVTAVAGGKCVITAQSYEGGHKATCTITVKQKVTGVNIAKTSLSLYQTQTYTLKATVLPSTATNKTVYYKSSNTSVATVDSAGRITAKTPGTATITVTTADGSYTAKCTVKVTKKISVSKITLDTTSKSIYKGKTYTIVATVYPSNASEQTVTWKSSDTKVATVSSKGVVTGVKSGTAVISATTKDGGYVAKCKITVYQKVTAVKLNASSVSLAKGTSKTLKATVYPSDATNKNVKWSSSNTSVVTVAQNGVITAKGPGTATVTVKTENGSFTANCNVTVYVPVTSIKLSATKLTMAKNTEKLIRATISPSSATNSDVRWASSNTTVASVSQAGVVTAKQKGTTKITAFSNDGKVSATCIVTVIQQVTQVNLSATSVSLDVGKTKTIEATLQPDNATYKSVTWKSSDKSVATVSSTGVIKALKAGVVTITATSKDKYASATCKVTVTQPATGIVLNYAKAAVRVGGYRVLKATVLPGNVTDATVVWRSSNDKIATVDQNGVVTGKSKGTVYITAINETGKSAKCLITVFKSVKGITLNKTSMTLEVGKYSTITPTIIPSDAGYKTVKWTSSNNDVATVSSAGRVTAKSAGYAKITATTTDGGKTAVCEVLVIQPATGIKLSKTTASVAKGERITLKATVLPSDASDKSVTWSSSNTSVAKVTSKGVVTGVNRGKAVITVKAKDGGFTAKCTVTVLNKVKGVTLNKSSATIYIGKTLALKATVNPSDANNKGLYWYSGNKNIATVDQKGVVTPVKVGKVTIGVRTDDGGFKDYCLVTVKKAVASFTINRSSLSLNVGQYFTFTSKVLPSDATDKTIRWTSSDTSVLAISQKGLIKAKKRGTATVTATTHNGLVAKCVVTVKQPVTGVELNKSSFSIYTGKTYQLECDVLPSDANTKTVTWTSSAPSVATVSSKGLVTALKAGTTTVTVKTKDGSFTAKCKVTVKQAVTSIKLDKTSLSLRIGESYSFNATVLPSDATYKTVKWTSSDPTVLSVSSSGVVKALKKGTATVTATSSNGLTSKCKVDVIQSVTGIEISRSAVTLYTGRTYTLTYDVYPENANNRSVVWSSDNEGVASVSSTGVITANRAGTATVTVKTKDGGFTAQCKVTVKQYAESIKLSKTSVSLKEGASYTLKDTILPEDTTDKSVTWTSSDTSVATVSGGVIKAISKGTATITAETSNGLTAKCTVKVIRVVTGVEISQTKATVYTGGTYALSCEVIPSTATDTTVTWTSSDESVATVSSEGVVTAKKAGTATITVTTKDGGFTGKCIVTVKQNATSVKMSKTSLSVREGKSDVLTATVLPEDTTDKSITWKSSDENVATVTQNGEVKGIQKGTATITASTSNGISGKCTVTVIRSVTGVEINKAQTVLYTGESEVLTCEVLPATANDKSVTWSSSDNTVVTVDNDGTVTALKAGKAIVTVKTKDGSKTAECEVQVKQHVESVSLDKTSVVLERTQQATLTATVLPKDASDKTYTFKSSDDSIATVNGEGIITAVKAGKAVVTVTTTDSKKTAKCTVTVVEPVTGVSFSINEKTLYAGNTTVLDIKIEPENATNKAVEWFTSDKDVAGVSADGVITLKKAGTAVITVKTKDGGFTDTCSLTVLQSATSIEISKSELTMNVGDGYTLKANVLPDSSHNKDVIWSSSDDSIATVNNKGAVEAVNPGEAVITARSVDGGFEATCKVTVIQPVQGVSLNSGKLTLYKGESEKLVASVAPDNASDKGVTWMSTDTTVASVIDGVVVAKAKGTTTIIVKTNDGGFTDICDVTVVIPASGITPEKSEYTVNENEQETISAVVVPSDAHNKELIYHSSDEKIATVNNKGVITGISKGKATITICISDNESVFATVDVEVKRPVKSVTLDSTAHEMFVGNTVSLKATVLPEGANEPGLIWSTSDKTVAAVNGSGVVTAKAPGTATVTVKTKDGGYTAQCNITVYRMAEQVVFPDNEYSVDTGKSLKLTATVLPEDTSFKELEWTSSDEKIATVNADGVVTGVKAGVVTIKAQTVQGQISASVKLNVIQKAQSVSINADKTVLWTGDTLTLTATVLPEDTTDKAVKWESLDENILTVDESGLITALKAGKAKVKATSVDGGASSELEFEVREYVKQITLDKTDKAVQTGDVFTLTATVLPEDAYDKTVSWSSSDDEIATVDADGKVTAHKSGAVVITAKSHDGKVQAQCRVRIIKLVESITLSKTALTVEKGTQFRLVATVLPEDATEKAVTWTSSDNSVLTVDSNGNIKTLKGGVATVTATTSTEGVKAECVVNVEVSSTSITLDKTKADMYCGDTLTLKASFLPEDTTNKKVIWSSDNKAVAEVSADGVVTALTKGKAVITATAEDTGVSAECEIEVLKHTESVSISGESQSCFAGESMTLTATVLPEDATEKAVTWTSSDENVLKVDRNGNVTALSKGVAKITVTTVEGAKTAEYEITVMQKAQSVSVDAQSIAIKVGTSFTLTATVLPENTDDKTVVFTSSEPETASVDENGKVTAHKTGTAVITATSKVNPEAKTSCTVTVIKGVDGIYFNSNECEMFISQTVKLGYRIEPVDATNKAVSFASSDTSVATVDAEGNVTAKAVGTALITVAAKDSGFMDVCYLKVKQPVTSLKLDKTAYTADKNTSFTLTTTVLPENAADKSIIWSSSDESIATVKDGVVTIGSLSGTVVITATAADREQIKAQCTVTVKEPVSSITLSKTSVYLRKGESIQIDATVLPENATDKTVVWSVMDKGVATVDNGKITAVASGKTYVIVTSKDGSFTEMCAVNVYREIETLNVVAAQTLKAGTSSQVKVEASPSYHDEKFTYESSDEAVLSIDSTGLMTANAAGSAVITVTSSISGKTAKVTVTVH